MKKIQIYLIGVLAMLCSCHYLDVVPDNVATIDYAFRSRNEAEKYLFTCYSFIPSHSDPSSNPALVSGDEMWFYYPYSNPRKDYIGNFSWRIARGDQNVIAPLLNYWDGENGGKDLYEGIRDCNIFLENIRKVPDMQSNEKKRWIAEVTFLKAYFHFWLVRMYGPIPIIDKNLPVSAPPDQVQKRRMPVDSCFNYIVRLINKAAADLPDQISKKITEMGRITKLIALAMKARVLVTAASPLFNGNPDYANFVDKKGNHLFNAEYDAQKWVKASNACKAAINLCQKLGYHLYKYQPEMSSSSLSQKTIIKMSIRNSVCESWNPEIIWGNRNSMTRGLQSLNQPNIYPQFGKDYKGSSQIGSVPLKIAEMFYTQNGLPITEDKTLDYSNIAALRSAADSEWVDIVPGYQTARLNFDREPRFYADLGFDGGIWYGQGEYDDTKASHVEAKKGQYSSVAGVFPDYNVTGYWAKKMVDYQNAFLSSNSYFIDAYPWPVIRLADIYLLYAEALNEVSGPGPEVYKYIDMVRARAGIPSVELAWTDYSKDPGKYQTKNGMREIIHRERLIEMAFEGQRFWDLRRWKEAENTLNQPIRGWNIFQESAQAYYHPVTLFIQQFKKRDYFWPIKDNDLVVDKRLVQNPGW